MSERERAEMALLDWSELGVSGLPTGTVTLLLADVEGSTRLWETQPDAMTAAVAQLDRILTDVVGAHNGVRPVEQGEGDSFVVAFGRASDAVACALALQRASLAPIRLRIGLHTGEAQLRDDANYIGSSINRTARLRDLAHGGQTVLSSTTSDLVADRLPLDAWLTDLGTHPLRDLPRPERVLQLCHPEIRDEFPPLRTSKAVRLHNLPAQLTSFIGRQTEMAEVRQALGDNRLVTLTGAGGSGKTRLAIEIAGQLTNEFGDGVWYVDLSPITNPAVVPVTVARTFGLPDQPGRSPTETVVRFISDRNILLLLDNCEHLLDSCGQLIVELLNACPDLRVLTTSREPISVAGEVTWRVPSLSIVGGEAIDLFTDRAQRARPGFQVADSEAAQIGEVCQRLDGMPLAIELAAARVRALSLAQIASSLNDRFRLLTGGARTAVRRQQTLRASVDWSHTLLTESERVLFRRLGVFMGGFDLDAAQAVGGSTEIERYQILDLLSLLVDKSLVIAEEVSGTMRYRLLETMRQYALERLGESGEAEAVRTRHREYYVHTATQRASTAQPKHERLSQWADLEMDNLRSAYAWSCELLDFETALQLTSSLQHFWVTRSRMREGLADFDGVFGDQHFQHDEVAPQVWVRAVADQCFLAGWLAGPASLDRAQQALDTARQLDDPALLARALAACGTLTIYDAQLAEAHFAEAVEQARTSGDWEVLCSILGFLAPALNFAGDLTGSRAAAAEGLALAEALNDRFMSSNCRVWLAIALMMQGSPDEASRVYETLAADATTDGNLAMIVLGQVVGCRMHADLGHAVEAHACARAALDAAAAMGGFHEDAVCAVSANAALASGDAVAAKDACESAMRHTVPQRAIFVRGLAPTTEALLGCGELLAARRWADETIAVVPGWHKMVALTARAYVAMAQAEPAQAECDAHDALGIAQETRGYLHVPEILECLARLAVDTENHSYAARLFGAATALRERMGKVRLPIFQSDYDAAVTAARDTVGEEDFDAAWLDGAALSTEDAIAYARRGRGERKRPATGWESLTPTERDVVRLVSEGLPNKDVAARLFISPRTVQTHLTHIYTKLGVTSRVQLVQEAAHHT